MVGAEAAPMRPYWRTAVLCILGSRFHMMLQVNITCINAKLQECSKVAIFVATLCNSIAPFIMAMQCKALMTTIQYCLSNRQQCFTGFTFLFSQWLDHEGEQCHLSGSRHFSKFEAYLVAVSWYLQWICNEHSSWTSFQLVHGLFTNCLTLWWSPFPANPGANSTHTRHSASCVYISLLISCANNDQWQYRVAANNSSSFVTGLWSSSWRDHGIFGPSYDSPGGLQLPLSMSLLQMQV